MPQIDPKDLPPTLRMITTIRSASLRFKLAESVDSVLRLSKETENQYVAQSVKDIANRFFSYLLTSCGNPILINTRASWLLVYAKCVEFHLLRSLGRRSGHVKNTPQPVFKLTNLTMKLVEDVVSYYCRVLPGSNVVSESLEILETIVALVDRPGDETDHEDYRDLIRKIENTLFRVELFKSLGLLNESQNSAFLNHDLHDICLSLQHYDLKHRR